MVTKLCHRDTTLPRTRYAVSTVDNATPCHSYWIRQARHTRSDRSDQIAMSGFRSSRADRFLTCMIYSSPCCQGGSRVVCTMWHLLPGLDLYRANPPQHFITAASVPNDVDHGLSEVCTVVCFALYLLRLKIMGETRGGLNGPQTKAGMRQPGPYRCVQT